MSGSRIAPSRTQGIIFYDEDGAWVSHMQSKHSPHCILTMAKDVWFNAPPPLSPSCPPLEKLHGFWGEGPSGLHFWDTGLHGVILSDKTAIGTTRVCQQRARGAELTWDSGAAAVLRLSPRCSEGRNSRHCGGFKALHAQCLLRPQELSFNPQKSLKD